MVQDDESPVRLASPVLGREASSAVEVYNDITSPECPIGFITIFLGAVQGFPLASLRPSLPAS